VVAPLTSNGKKCRVESPNWWVEHKTVAGKMDRRKGFKDKSATMKLGFDLERESEDVRSGRSAGARTEAPAHLADYLPVFETAIREKGNSPGHIASVLHNVRTVVAGVPLTTPAAVDCERVAEWLASESRREAWSVANGNRYRLFLRQFGKWLVRTKRAKHNPFEELSPVKTNGAKSRERRRLPDDELQQLIRAARHSPDTVHGLAGSDRARLYLLAAYTGFRLGTLAKLTPDRFTWDTDTDRPIAVTAPGRIVKNKKPHTVPLHPDVAAELSRLATHAPCRVDPVHGRPVESARRGTRRQGSCGSTSPVDREG
jgi:integrase